MNCIWRWKCLLEIFSSNFKCMQGKTQGLELDLNANLTFLSLTFLI